MAQNTNIPSADIVPDFVHHYMPLLSVRGPQGQYGGREHVLAVQKACKIANRIDRSLAMASRVEVAVMPAEPDLFTAAPKQAKACKTVWTTISETPRLRWCILTRHPGNVTDLLPTDWIGGGYKNVCIEFVVSTAAGLTEGLEALRAVNARWRMLHVLPSALDAEEWPHSLDGIHWVVFSGTSENGPAAGAIHKSCREAGVAFFFHRTDGGESPAMEESSQPEHPFGPDVLLARPTLPNLQPLGKQISQDRPPPSEPVLTSPADPGPAEDMPNSDVSEIQDSGNITRDLEIIDGVDAAGNTTGHTGADAGCNVITRDDREDFSRLDHIVRHNLRYFIDAGRALMEIRNRELWRAGDHPSWAEYCQAVAGLTKIHANRLIRATEVADQISKVSQVKPIGFTPVAESQIRPLCRLEKPEQCAEAWSLGVERAGGQQPTAKLLRDVVAELVGVESKTEDPKSKVQKAKTPKPETTDPIAELFGRIFKSVRSREPHGKIEKQLLELKKALRFAGDGIRLVKESGDS